MLGLGSKGGSSCIDETAKFTRRSLRRALSIPINIRGKQIRNDRRFVADVQDVIEALYHREDRPRPLFNGCSQAEDGTWTVYFVIPAGVSHKDVISKKDYFVSAIGKDVVFEIKKNLLYITENDIELPDKLPYNWDRSQYTGKGFMPIPVGMTRNGFMVLPLEDSPHLLICGIPRRGKSNFLHVAITSLIPHTLVAVMIIRWWSTLT